VAKEFRIGHDKLRNSQTVTQVMADEFKKRGLNTKVNIALDVIDDPAKRQRIVKVKNTKYFDMGRK